MEKIALISNDRSLVKELSGVLPKGTKLTEGAPENESSFVFFDIDSMRPGMIRELTESHYVMAVTKQKWTERVMEAATFGAYEVIQRPLTPEVIAGLLAELQQFRDEIRDNIPIAPLPPTPTCAIVGSSPIIMDVCKKLARLSQVDAPVLITGETGTGKELTSLHSEPLPMSSL